MTVSSWWFGCPGHAGWHRMAGSDWAILGVVKSIVAQRHWRNVRTRRCRLASPPTPDRWRLVPVRPAVRSDSGNGHRCCRRWPAGAVVHLAGQCRSRHDYPSQSSFRPWINVVHGHRSGVSDAPKPHIPRQRLIQTDSSANWRPVARHHFAAWGRRGRAVVAGILHGPRQRTGRTYVAGPKGAVTRLAPTDGARPGRKQKPWPTCQACASLRRPARRRCPRWSPTPQGSRRRYGWRSSLPRLWSDRPDRPSRSARRDNDDREPTAQWYNYRGRAATDRARAGLKHCARSWFAKASVKCRPAACSPITMFVQRQQRGIIALWRAVNDGNRIRAYLARCECSYDQ